MRFENPSLANVAGMMGAIASIGWMTATALRPAVDVRTLGLVEVLFSYLVSRRLFREQITTSTRSLHDQIDTFSESTGHVAQRRGYRHSYTRPDPATATIGRDHIR